jgi:RNA polymerase sigma-70 factor, ECF subfamily
MTDVTVTAEPGPPGLPLADELESHRRELTAHCRRILGSVADAEDATQETLMRAWRKIDGFEGRSALGSWLHRIATRVCFDILDSRRRHPVPMDLAGSRAAEVAVPATLPRTAWMASTAGAGQAPTADDPAELAVARESVRLAFVATLQRLPSRQRAVLILREVLRWPAAEVAELLGTSVAGVNSALQRARATLDTDTDTGADRSTPLDPTQQALLTRYIDAFERHDMTSLVALLHGGERSAANLPPIVVQ